MPSKLRWQDLVGRETVNSIVKSQTPWKNGLYMHQLDLITPILDGDDILCCTATGDGKSASFSITIIVLNEYNKNPNLYPKGLPTRPNPCGIVITPTNGLSRNIVSHQRYPTQCNNIDT